uniref:RNA-directed DNA polymerase, eukaryota, reverse transcriptase zinc-binding domain protein n=1 Tax=Tanacetum cinerariifolium TaxID=118510 RepID=A0A699I465_TANCI|nr:RNA-directed DNA polymerase, eukaryota, reverse transcriptase zinc-binding domain protein [Tanacetum cinerariifolium]
MDMGYPKQEFKIDRALDHVCAPWKTCGCFHRKQTIQRRAHTYNFKVDERILWIEVSGLPLCAWGSNAYKKIASSFGKFLCFEKEESTALSSSRICISTKSHQLISKIIQVDINNEIFVASVQEIGSRSTKLKDDYTDLSSNHKYKDVDHVSESIDDQKVNDIEIIQSNLNKIDDHDLDVEPDLEGENKDGERDESIASPNKKLKEDIKTTYLDLSRPPGFKFMKKSSSSTSKFSTSFASHRKSDIKGVSLINELNKIIEVGTALGMSRGRSGGIISVWDPYAFTKDSIWCDDSFIIVKGKWNNSVGSCYMVNIYAPQDQTAKYSLWNRLKDFMHHNDGSYIFFEDMNVVRNEQERYGSSFNSIEADHFNVFIESTDVTNLLPDIRITALDRLWSDHNLILLQAEKIDYGPLPFKFYNSWLSRDSFDDFVKSEWNMLDVNLKCHDKFRRLKAKIRQWSSINKTRESNKKVIALEELSSIKKKIHDGSASQADKENRINIIHEIEKLDSLESMDLLQKAHIK